VQLNLRGPAASAMSPLVVLSAASRHDGWMINYVLLLLCLGSATAASAPLGVRGWYELGATVVEDAKLESFFEEPVSGNKVEFDPGFRGAIALGKELSRYVALEAEGGFHYNSIRSIGGAGADNGELYQFPVLGNLVLQFPNRTRLVPVIGGGVGAVFSILDGNDIALGGSRLSDSEETWSFAYQGYGGLMYSFRPDMALGISYHYLRNDGPNWDFGDGNNVKFDRLVNHSIVLTYNFRF
jgi:opacity protein-like surface antigen